PAAASGAASRGRELSIAEAPEASPKLGGASFPARDVERVAPPPESSLPSFPISSAPATTAASTTPPAARDMPLLIAGASWKCVAQPESARRDVAPHRSHPGARSAVRLSYDPLSGALAQ